MTPFLIVTLGVPAPTAIGTDLVYATVTKMVGSVQHYRQQSVNLEVALFLGFGEYSGRSYRGVDPGVDKRLLRPRPGGRHNDDGDSGDPGRGRVVPDLPHFHARAVGWSPQHEPLGR